MRPSIVRALALMGLPAALVVVQRSIPAAAPRPAQVVRSLTVASTRLPPIQTLVAEGLPGMDGLAERLGVAARPLGLLPRWALDASGAAPTSPLARAFAPPPGPVRPLVLNGHGDFHHLTYFVLRDYVDPLGLPFCVVNFDAHDDARARAERGIDYGNWGRFALEYLPNLKRLVQIGIPQNRLRDWGRWLWPGGFLTGRLDLLPASELTFFSSERPPATTLWSAERRDVVSALVGRDGWQVAMQRFQPGSSLAARVPTPYAYVTVDMDVLAEDEFDDMRWGTGRLRVDDILTAVRGLSRERSLLGADVTGYPPSHLDRLTHPLEAARCEASYRRLIEGLRAALEESGP